MRYVRFQSPEVGRRGAHVGVFGLVNGLSRQGLLDEDEERFRRRNNDWYDASYTDPSTVDPTVYDHDVNPGAVAWFKESAVHLVERVDGYLRILAAHGVACERVESADPGQVVYEDSDQVVVVPRGGTRSTPEGHLRGRTGHRIMVEETTD